LSAAYDKKKYTAVVETKLLRAEKRAQKERSKFRVKRERLEILHPQWVSAREGEESSLKEKWAEQRVFIGPPQGIKWRPPLFFVA
jgi:hypothetical protein